MKRIKMFENFPEEDELDRLTTNKNNELKDELYNFIDNLIAKYGRVQVKDALDKAVNMKSTLWTQYNI